MDMMSSILERIKRGYIPKEREMTMADDDGYTVAHYVARFQVMPELWEYWTLKDNEGWTPAHQAASYRMLPHNFNHWDVKDNKGDTVAHVAARYGHLPLNLFNKPEIMGLKNNEDKTVFQVYREYSSERLEACKKILAE